MGMSMMGRGRDIHDIQAANEEAGFHFFEPETLSFFRSKIEKQVYGGKYFITSEQFEFRGMFKPRKWTIRQAEEDGSIETVGEFQQYDSFYEAQYAVRKLVEKEALEWEEEQAGGAK